VGCGRSADLREQLAERAEMSATYIGYIERGNNVPTLTIILQIASALGVRPAALLREF
jgi:transcriptional regulator with XRE-family HTH domain